MRQKEWSLMCQKGTSYELQGTDSYVPVGNFLCAGAGHLIGQRGASYVAEGGLLCAKKAPICSSVRGRGSLILLCILS